MEKICRIPASDLNKNQQFILGRNLYQANGYAWEVQTFFENLEKICQNTIKIKKIMYSMVYYSKYTLTIKEILGMN